MVILLSLIGAASGTSIARADEAAVCAKILENHLGSINDDFKMPDGPVTSVDLEGDDSVQVFDRHLVLLKQFKSLAKLTLRNTAITTQGLKELKDCESLIALKIVQFGGRFGSGQVRIGDAGAREIAEIKSLTTLDLTATGITRAGLSELKRLKNLTSLCLREGRVADAGLKEVGQIATLKKLDLARPLTTDAGLTNLRELTDLEQLILVDTYVSDAGLANLHELTNLEQLILVDTRVTEAGLKELRHFKRLTVLRLRGVKITAPGVAYLKELKGLKALAIAKSGIGEGELAELKEAFPDTQISTESMNDFLEIPESMKRFRNGR
jgi:hypothetical protein